MSDPSHVTLIYRRAAGFRERRELSEFAERLRVEVAAGRPFDCLVTDDRELRRLNRDFLKNDLPTDVLSFPAGQETAWLGEMAISAERAAGQCGGYGHSPFDEIRILMLHGLLHLMGLDHERDRGRMRRVEDQWRKKLQLPAGLIERARR